jgi:hypothetical protein
MIFPEPASCRSFVLSKKRLFEKWRLPLNFIKKLLKQPDC